MTERPIARKSGLVVQEASNEVLVYDTKANKALCLNESAAAVWNLCNGKLTPAEIAADLSNKFHSEVTEDFVWLAIDQLENDSLLEARSKASNFSRRDALKRIGFAAAIALPVVGVLSFPKDALAVNCGNSICSEADGSGGCPGGQHCCRGTCETVGVACSPACP